MKSQQIYFLFSILMIRLLYLVREMYYIGVYKKRQYIRIIIGTGTGGMPAENSWKAGGGGAEPNLSKYSMLL